jgi:asparagine synthetase B (glutamine-hydrolysing)
VCELLFETDWLGSRPVYYNEATGAAGRDINDVIAFADVELDAEGLAAYLANGYSVFQRTPVRGVRIMPPSARLWRDADGELRIEEVPLDLAARLTTRPSEDEILEMLRARVQAAESAAEGAIVIPTSGGYDSRLLNLMIAEPSRVRSYTFGPTARQWDSTEVARARALSELLGTEWRQVHLDPFHCHLDEWDEAFGVAVHAHGMYQMEFYQRVRAQSEAGALVLSGLCGDGFAGSVDPSLDGPMDGPRDVQRLIFTNGMHADSGAAVLPFRGTLAEEYFETHREMLRTHAWRLIEEVRFRVLLTHYLLKVPELYGFRVDAPFLDIDVAAAMLTLPAERRRKRRWITEYLASRGAQLDDVHGNGRYWLYWPVMRAQPLAPLDAGLLAEIVKPDYVRWINRTVSWRGLWYEGYERLSRRPGGRRAAAYLRATGLRQRRLEAYYAYMTLRPLQRLLQKRDAARAAGPVERLRQPEDARAPVLT